jgi:hypothetical protein
MASFSIYHQKSPSSREEICVGDNQHEREAVKAAYPSDSWKEKVDKMSPAQITAIYLRLKAQGKLGT